MTGAREGKRGDEPYVAAADDADVHARGALR
jgi:hypothetical protein